MSQRKVVVAGALGLIGRAVVEHLTDDDNAEAWDVIGLSRRTPDFDCGATFLSVDLTDRDACLRDLTSLRDTTHLVFAALYEKPNLGRGWFEPDHIETNLAMLRNLFDAIESPRLEHVTLLQGTKAYGVHHGFPVPVPAREDAPRVEHENFYFYQEDFLRERQEGRDWKWTVLRPQVVCGMAVGSAMNVVATLGAYAAIAAETGQPFSHPGHANAFSECTDARLLARAIRWVATTPRCANQIYNITNGDALTWRSLWPRLAEFFGLEVREPEAQLNKHGGEVSGLLDERPTLSDEMPKQAKVWRDIATRDGLRVADLDAFIGLSWQYADMIWANPRPPGLPVLLSTIKARQHGFADCIDSEESVIELLEQMRRERYLPERGRCL